MASFIKIRPFMTDDLLFAPPRRGARLTALDVVPREPSTQDEVIETEKEFQISLDVPGVKSSDLSVTTDNKSIHISGSRRVKGTGGEIVKKSKFAKSFPVDAETVDLSQLKANLSDGVLVVSAPKKPKAEPRSILITTNPHEPDEDKADDARQAVEADKSDNNASKAKKSAKQQGKK